MKVLLDENLSPALAKALAALFHGQHEVTFMRAKFGGGVKDVEWIEALSAEDKWVVISGDRRISRVPSELRAFRASRLIGFFLAKAVYKAPVTQQMIRLLQMWDVIERQAPLVQGGAMFEIPQKSKALRLLS